MSEEQTNGAKGRIGKNGGERVLARPEDSDRGPSVEEGSRGSLDHLAGAIREQGVLWIGELRAAPWKSGRVQ